MVMPLRLCGGTLIPEGYHYLFIIQSLAHIAPIGARGEPQSTPVWIGWDGENLRFSQTKRQFRSPTIAARRAADTLCG